MIRRNASRQTSWAVTFFDYIGHQGIVGGVTGLRGFDPGDRIDSRDVEIMTRLGRKLFEILRVGSAVSFSKWMNVIHVTDDHCRLLRKFRDGEVSQETALN